MYTLSEINIYPIKSLGGVNLQSSEVEMRGLKYDRRWMLVENGNTFITQRKYPQLALLQVSVDAAGLRINHKIEKLNELFISFDYDHKESREVIIWDDIVPGLLYEKSVDDWFSEIIKIKCRLVFMPDDAERVVEPERVQNKIVSFADAYPFLIIGQSSLEDLNSRLKEPLPMNRFRPNFVVSGSEPYEEDSWKSFKISNVIFHGIKPCARCAIPTINQQTAEKGEEPLTTLSTYRKVNNKINFGMNLVCDTTGVVKVGDQIDVL